MSARTRHAVTDTLPALFPQAFPGYAEDARLDLPPRPRASVDPRAGRRLPGQVRDQVSHRHGRHRRLRATARQLAARAQAADQAGGGEAGPYGLLGKWVHMLGFRGHFASKSRRYSITLGALRRARRRAQALIADSRDTGRPLDLAALEADLLADDDADTALVIGHWTYAGTGWATEGQRVLANAAAARAREYDQWKAEQRRATENSGEGTR